ncbi:Crp/Fnr family transcriptional regulator [Noviherbaspirillum soli]|uniref:Crp/Fnr family transcriptional regulator n=1 Tax=Noviherbaspirillum soli TaxID=1064518 RepID=UPI00188A5390|nr:Crp/Fnr family transcriptional regulator [Noviherbaspirillum soli]
MSTAADQTLGCDNQLLAKLPDEEYQALLPLFDLVETPLKEVLYRQGEPISHVYFPCTSVHSCVVYMEDGAGVEVGTMGNEGFTGVEVLLDATLATETSVCQIAGTSLRMQIDDFREALGKSITLRKILRCSGQAYLSQVSQAVACNRLHNIEMRFARWLLVTHDRVRGDAFHLTQEFLAAMLGVHRPSISVVAAAFQEAGMISYCRGHLTILDRPGLEASACECYGTVRRQFERLLGAARG